MQLNRGILLVTILAAAGVAGAAWMIGCGEPGVELTRPSPRLHWPVGAQQRYTVNVDSKVEIENWLNKVVDKGRDRLPRQVRTCSMNQSSSKIVLGAWEARMRSRSSSVIPSGIHEG